VDVHEFWTAIIWNVERRETGWVSWIQRWTQREGQMGVQQLRQDRHGRRPLYPPTRPPSAQIAPLATHATD